MSRYLLSYGGAIAVSLGLSLLSGGMVPAAAQSTTVDPLGDLNSTDSPRDPFSSNGSGQTGGLFDLLHQIQTSNGGSREDQLDQNREEINSSATQFRREQLERLNQAPAQAADPGLEPETDESDSPL